MIRKGFIYKIERISKIRIILLLTQQKLRYFNFEKSKSKKNNLGLSFSSPLILPPHNNNPPNLKSRFV
ncbi:unnamed protein product [marine sediment metagenome]|uniref:Uncharacterized protein n=1 Tax=marine sediment metagenome TaxID=412755 RepID=X1G101_9ZZZZ